MERIKEITMVQWMNIHRNDSFVNWKQLPWLCEKSAAIPLVLVGLMAGRQADRQSDEILVDLKIFKILYQLHCWDFQGV